MRHVASSLRAGVLALGALTLVNPAWALFGDDEARKAILELRQSFEEQRRLNAEGATIMRRSILDVSTQADQWRQELAQLRGQQEQLLQDNRALLQTIAALQTQLAALDARVKTLEPITVNLDGETFAVSAPEKLAYERAKAFFLASDFAKASATYAQFLSQFPVSAYTPSVLYWLGHAQYAHQDVKSSIQTHKRLVAQFPQYARVPEALLALGNAHDELGEAKAARAEWDVLIKTYPKSEAAVSARERIKSLPRQ